MKRMLMIVPTLLLLAVPASAQWIYPDRRDAGPDLSGTWYMNGNATLPCSIEQRPSGRVLFTNEKGSAAWGRVFGNHVSIPDWSPGDGIQGLQGTIRGDRIVWPDGDYWSRWAR